jgi:hypothetical protein
MDISSPNATKKSSKKKKSSSSSSKTAKSSSSSSSPSKQVKTKKSKSTTSKKEKHNNNNHHHHSGTTSSDDNSAFLYDDTPIPEIKDYPSLPVHELPDPDLMLLEMNKEIKALKQEAKRLFDEMETGKSGSKEEQEELLAIKREAQLEKLKGNELIKVEQLIMMGFDETVMREHLEGLNKALRDEARAKQKDVRNLENNVDKMIQMNKECERAVTAAHGAYGPLIAKQQVLQAKLEQAEVELYALETKVEHRRNMKSVELASKSKFKGTIKDIVRKFKIRCRDQDLLREVLVKAGRSLETDLKNNTDLDDDDSDSDSSSSSSSDRASSEEAVEVEADDSVHESSELDTGSSSDDFSVSVSSVES